MVRARPTVLGVAAAAVILAVGWEVGVKANDAQAPVAAAPSAPTDSAPSSTPSGAAARGASASTGAAKPATTTATVVGATESTRYGDVRVEIKVRAAKIVDVVALHLTDRNGRSVQISAQAAPILRSEVLKAQSAKVQAVSGATYTTDGYLSSVQSAIDRAGL